MPRPKTHPVKLSSAEREVLTQITRAGAHPAQHVRRARILLQLDENAPGRDGPISIQTVVTERAGVSAGTVVKFSKTYADRGGDALDTITRKKRLTPPVEPKVTGRNFASRLCTGSKRNIIANVGSVGSAN